MSRASASDALSMSDSPVDNAGSVVTSTVVTPAMSSAAPS
jgi:hypothetical protein